MDVVMMLFFKFSRFFLYHALVICHITTVHKLSLSPSTFDMSVLQSNYLQYLCCYLYPALLPLSWCCSVHKTRWPSVINVTIYRTNASARVGADTTVELNRCLSEIVNLFLILNTFSSAIFTAHILTFPERKWKLNAGFNFHSRALPLPWYGECKCWNVKLSQTLSLDISQVSSVFKLLCNLSFN